MSSLIGGTIGLGTLDSSLAAGLGPSFRRGYMLGWYMCYFKVDLIFLYTYLTSPF